jgi:hypothetical protein
MLEVRVFEIERDGTNLPNQQSDGALTTRKEHDIPLLPE